MINSAKQSILSLPLDGLLRRCAPRNDEKSLLGRDDRPLDLAKTDAVAVALAPAAHHQRIAVFEEGAFDAAGEFKRLGAVPADLKQTAALMLFRAGDRATAEEIADIHGAARGGVVHELLHRR